MRPALTPARSAILGLACLLPFLTANFIVANRLEPFFSLIRPGPHTALRELALLAVLLLLVLAGSLLAAAPLLCRQPRSLQRIYPLNATLAALLLLCFITVTSALAREIYLCEILHVPNCD